MPYSEVHILDQELGNNAFAWEERMRKYGVMPTLTIPSLIDGDISDVQIGQTIAFEEIENGVIKSCQWLRHFVRMKIPRNHQIEKQWNPVLHAQELTIFDNHNHALYFWLDAVRRGIVKAWFELIHIDEHSDLWHNDHTLDLEKSLSDEAYAWEFTNLSCNVGNYIAPALRSELIGKMIRIENEFQIDEYMNYMPPQNSVLNLDLDIFAHELDHIPETKKIQLIKNLLKKVKYTTIATSPYFIEQWLAIEKLKDILLA